MKYTITWIIDKYGTDKLGKLEYGAYLRTTREKFSHAAFSL